MMPFSHQHRSREEVTSPTSCLLYKPRETEQAPLNAAELAESVTTEDRKDGIEKRGNDMTRP